MRIAKMPTSEPVLTLADAKKKAAEIMLNVGLDGISYEELLGLDLNESAFNTKRRFLVGALGSFYIGYTARQLDEECLRWLTQRGASKKAEDGTFVDLSKRNRPVLLMHDGSTITMGKARKELGFDPLKLNPLGGAIALGHPLGGTGAKLMTTLVHEMKRDEKKKYGLLAICEGGGTANATIVERC